MKKYLLILSFPFISSYSLSSGLDKNEVLDFNKQCVDASNNHERRIFDALSNSEYINWSKIKLVDTTSRLNYTDTVLGKNEGSGLLACDLVINYLYDDKDIVLNSSYQVSPENNQTISRVAVTEKAITDFIVQVIVN
ncbi:hypothetical protein [Aliivibrio sp. EL58]|uniref:hypothetical protein n=1 Tax=Aliivibrio sp. EL58 TaxID=2107582 RepID=UPI000EFC410F|nr:hypothetical protein [Aliivibrio sp. EL58]